MQNVKHEELINGIMMRLDHINTDIAHIKDHADDKIEEARKQLEFKEKVCYNCCYGSNTSTYGPRRHSEFAEKQPRGIQYVGCQVC